MSPPPLAPLAPTSDILRQRAGGRSGESGTQGEPGHRYHRVGVPDPRRRRDRLHRGRDLDHDALPAIRPRAGRADAQRHPDQAPSRRPSPPERSPRELLRPGLPRSGADRLRGPPPRRRGGAGGARAAGPPSRPRHRPRHRRPDARREPQGVQPGQHRRPGPARGPDPQRRRHRGGAGLSAPGHRRPRRARRRGGELPLRRTGRRQAVVEALGHGHRLPVPAQRRAWQGAAHGPALLRLDHRAARGGSGADRRLHGLRRPSGGRLRNRPRGPGTGAARGPAADGGAAPLPRGLVPGADLPRAALVAHRAPDRRSGPCRQLHHPSPAARRRWRDPLRVFATFPRYRQRNAAGPAVVESPHRRRDRQRAPALGGSFRRGMCYPSECSSPASSSTRCAGRDACSASATAASSTITEGSPCLFAPFSSRRPRSTVSTAGPARATRRVGRSSRSGIRRGWPSRRLWWRTAV